MSIELQLNNDGLDCNPALNSFYYVNFSKGFTYVLTDLALLNLDLVNKFADAILQSEYRNCSMYNFSTGKNYDIRIAHAKFNLYISHKEYYYISIFADSLETLHDLFIMYNDYNFNSNLRTIKFDEYSMYADGYLNITSKEIGNEFFYKAKEWYYPYLNVNALFSSFFNSEQSILIFTGESGTGKSKLEILGIQRFIDWVNSDLEHSSEVSVAHVFNPRVMSEDQFWSSIYEKNTELVIIDDLDYYLNSRHSEVTSSEDTIKNDFLKKLLTFSDGIKQNHTKFIISSNQDINDIDNAILRKGRLFDLLQLRKLNEDEARDVWAKSGLDVSKFNLNCPILSSDLSAAIYQAKSVNNDYNYVYDAKVSLANNSKLFKKSLGL